MFHTITAQEELLSKAKVGLSPEVFMWCFYSQTGSSRTFRMSKESYFAKTLIRKKHGPSVTATKKTEFASYAFKITNKNMIQHERMPRIRHTCVQTESVRKEKYFAILK